ncbi:hypothetical protein DW691_20585 [Bacteroides xylanisolvens]|uniref:Uncharacterized protein n=1 Tax=Bacteroides xylanisolvens TaxID=371601 RepID=A0A415KBG0_9BACE|nr:hypothetical protein DW691_20585 [Bacteroides xylanisolvens]RHL33598.1 hypothetical protein DW027_21300 [Bacteroides xylanisolvens]RYT23899.1 hypothetical protein EAJ13_00805 [Bacteroides xylanisolvens]
MTDPNNPNEELFWYILLKKLFAQAFPKTFQLSLAVLTQLAQQISQHSIYYLKTHSLNSFLFIVIKDIKLYSTAIKPV